MRKKLFLAFVLAAAVAGPAFGAPIYMQYEGVPGEVTVAGHNKWIEIDSVQWGVALPAPPPAPAPAGVATGGPGTVRFVRKADKASPLLSKAAATGRIVPAVQIDVPKGTAYQRYELKNVMISSYSVSGQGAGDPIPTESISFNFSKLEFAYAEQKATSSGVPPLAGYSLTGAPKTPTPSKGATQAPAVSR